MWYDDWSVGLSKKNLISDQIKIQRYEKIHFSRRYILRCTALILGQHKKSSRDMKKERIMLVDNMKTFLSDLACYFDQL